MLERALGGTNTHTQTRIVRTCNCVIHTRARLRVRGCMCVRLCLLHANAHACTRLSEEKLESD